MVNAGILGLTVVDDWMARIWAKVLPRFAFAPTSRCVTRADRLGDPQEQSQLAAELAGMLPSLLATGGGSNSASRASSGGSSRSPTTLAARMCSASTRPSGSSDKYGARYGFDPFAAHRPGFQESKLRQDVRSHAGRSADAVLPVHRQRDLKVGDITQLEPNIHAGSKYGQLMTRYFPDASFDALNRPLFAFASYNAGPGAIARLRGVAERRGLTPTGGSTTSRSW
jgi:membrane-bound lytic murein transglycosylase MltF